jgi:hypothetical protein
MWFEHGVSLISGSRVIDEAAVIRTVGQGATFQQVEGVRKLTLVRQDAHLGGVDNESQGF